MKKPLMVAVSTLGGVTAAGVALSVLAWPAQASAGDTQLAVKREQDTADVVLVDDDDDPDDPTNADTRTNTGTSTGAVTNTQGDDTRTGARSGRDDSRTGRAVRDWTSDGPGPKVRDWTRNHTNDNSRHNTRR
ncbi:hypothetical protein [Pimelobacter simplex]|uniref:hypothetical protein n=1 Tax=Nocardioides simplex TaxID=2045 RepID=UPI0019334EBB|nr:hypothetical protein [Pimelobacter simplex]